MPRTILVADDSVTIRKVVELTFLDTGFRVVAVGSGREALDLLGELRPDLVLVDVVMPGPTGYDVCRAVKSSPRPVPVLLLAGTFEPFDPAEARACGADGHLTKPFDSRTLVERVDALLAAGTLAPPEEPVPARTDDEIEAMFDDLAAPPGPEAADLPETAVRVEPEPEPVADPAPAEGSGPAREVAPPPATPAPGLTASDLDAIADAVVARLSERVLREIAWDVVPDLAEVIVRERLAELEREP